MVNLICATLECRRPVKSKPDVNTTYVSGRKIRGEVILCIEPASARKSIIVYIVPVVFERSVAQNFLILARIFGTERQIERPGLTTWGEKSSTFKLYWVKKALHGAPDCALEDEDNIDTFKDIDGPSQYFVDIV
jgi:hypothetical protein